MLLKYRGASYDLNPEVVHIEHPETVQLMEWEVPEQYRWVTFQAKHLIAILSPFDHHLKYRGAAY